MGSRKTAAFAVLSAGLILFLSPVILRGAAFEPALPSEVIAVGFKTVVTGTAAPGARVAITVSGPGAVPAAAGSAGADGKIMIPVGPFPARGSYILKVQSGTEQRSFDLDVEDQVADSALAQAAQQFDRAHTELVAAVENSINVVETQVGRFSPNDPGIPQAREGLARLHRQCQDMAEVVTTIIRGNAEFAALIGRPYFRPSREGWEQYYRQGAVDADALRARLNGVADPAEFEHLSDWCARALQAKAVCMVIGAVVERLRGTLREFLAEKVTGFLAGALAGQALYLANQGQGTQFQEQIVTSTASSFAEGAFAVMTKGLARVKWDLILEAADYVVNLGLDVYMNARCLSFSGRMAGHVHIEALEKTGAPYWGQDNDWEGDVTLTCAKPESSAPVPIWGLIYGKGKNFVGTNQLATLFPKGTLATTLFLTTQPRKLNQALAFFCLRLEGTVAGNTLTLKSGSTWVDMFNGMFSRFTSIVIPAASPIPLVQTHNIPFQNAGWQLSRTLSREGTQYLISMEYIGTDQTRRRVKGPKSRELTNPGARGRFTWKIDLCAGCPSDWKPDF